MVPASFVPTLMADYAANAPASRVTAPASHAYTFTEVYRSDKRETEFKDTIYVFRFVRPALPPASR